MTYQICTMYHFDAKGVLRYWFDNICQLRTTVCHLTERITMSPGEDIFVRGCPFVSVLSCSIRCHKYRVQSHFQSVKKKYYTYPEPSSFFFSQKAAYMPCWNVSR